jgi:AcrR family transcriptional regulator
VRERILDTACRLFYAEGVQGVGIDRILAEAQAAKASLYQHFAGKDALVAAYLERRAEQTQAALTARLQGGDARARLLRLFDIQKEFAGSPSFRGCPFQNATSELADPRHPARAVARRHRQWFHGLVRDLVAEAGAKDVERIASAILLLYDGASSASLADADPRAIDGARWAASRLLA